MAYTQTVPAVAARIGPRAPVWPLLLAPLVAGAYYLALRGGFAYSLESVVTDATDVASGEPGGPTWGTHWLYRSFAEAVSVAFGVYVAAGLARERARLAGIIGGLAISFVYLLRNSYILYTLIYQQSEDVRLIEPWYQHLIEGLVLIGAPLAGVAMGEIAKGTACGKPEGFAGINRWHFLWLWFAALAYSTGVISPLLHMWIESLMTGGYGDTVRTIVFGLPVITYAIPAVWGLSVLAHESRWSRTTDNVVGSIILIVGWFLATGIVYVWALLATFVLRSIFG